MQLKPLKMEKTMTIPARWYVTKSKSGHYTATLRHKASKYQAYLIARSTLSHGTPEQAKAEVTERLGVDFCTRLDFSKELK